MTSGHDPARAAHEPVRVCVLWSRLSGYLSASLHALVDQGAELLVVHEAAAPSAPFDDVALTTGFRSLSWNGAPDLQTVGELVGAFAPDVVVVNSWHIGAYRRVARRLRGRALRIVTVHNQWTATPKQLAARIAAPVLLHPTYDAAFVCDERQAVFAEKLGFPAERMLWGVNTCDQPQFAAVAAARGGAAPPPAFLYAGRLVDDKAIDVLAAAYRRYRAVDGDPWPLIVAGTGERAGLLAGIDGVEMVGFVQPSEVPAVFARAGALVLPSTLEPWGVVIHEAVSAGLSVVCTRACGAAARLVLDGYNGIVVSPGDVVGLAAALSMTSGATEEERGAVAAASTSLSAQYTPARWARTLLSGTRRLRLDLGLDVAVGDSHGSAGFHGPPVATPSERRGRGA
jgi:glycosyltransferase involved in cell wall biosynthesis